MTKKDLFVSELKELMKKHNITIVSPSGYETNEDGNEISVDYLPCFYSGDFGFFSIEELQ